MGGQLEDSQRERERESETQREGERESERERERDNMSGGGIWGGLPKIFMIPSLFKLRLTL